MTNTGLIRYRRKKDGGGQDDDNDDGLKEVCVDAKEEDCPR